MSRCVRRVVLSQNVCRRREIIRQNEAQNIYSISVFYSGEISMRCVQRTAHVYVIASVMCVFYLYDLMSVLRPTFVGDVDDPRVLCAAHVDE